MSQLTLPAVAKSFHTFCKKCDADRYHRVLAHASSTSAKLECEICKSRKTYSLPKEGTPKKSVTRSASSSSGASRTPSAKNHGSQYELYHQNHLGASSVDYSIKSKFSENQKIKHPKFGIGFVTKVYSDKVDVIFQDEVRTLMHARQ
ncbi:MAG: hypothetical protein ACK41T_13240 [Pseudobdellovibrio sp.]